MSSTGAKLSSVEIVDPSGVVTAAPDMAAARYGHTATLLQTGKVLVVGGECDLPTCTERSEEYDPALDVWEPSASIYQHPPLRFHASTLLENGKVLTSGGLNLTLGPTEDSTYASGSLYDAQRCKPPGLAGFVVGSITSAPSSLDLTAEGEIDWSYEIDGTTHHKSGVGMITPLSDVGAPTKAMRGSGSTTYSWADGEPDPSRTTDLVLGFSGALGDGYAISFPTSPALRIAKLRLGALSGAGLLRVELSGNACSFYEAVVQDTSKEVSLLYMSPNAGDWLTARFTLLEAGELAAEGMSLRSAPLAATMFETDEDPTKSSFIVRVDNPLVTSRLKLDLTPTVWAGVVPEWVNASSGGVEMYNGDFGYLASGGEASPNANNTAPGNAGALDDSFFSWPNATGTFTAATAADEFTAHGRGLRVGYSPMNVEPRKTLPDLTTSSTGPPVSVQLDTNVHLVPIQVIVVSSTNFPKNTRLTDQLALFDQIQNPEVFNITYGGELVKTTKAFAGVVNGTLPWMNPSDEGLYNVIGFDTPDSAWRSCGIQFRLVNYFEFQTLDKYVLPNQDKGPVFEGGPKFDTHFSATADESAPCFGIRSLVGADPRFVQGVLPVIYMRRTSWVDSAEDGRFVGSGAAGAACVHRGSGRNVLAHELGHGMGLPDCDCSNPNCKMMCTFGGGGSPASPSECAGARPWAQTASAVFR
ncbi:MAG: hypothetical protein JST00_17080 [Deltaproteobacteria bacterium]|nr:hypothetical protein [Deltaproteobacteria bacterium]